MRVDGTRLTQGAKAARGASVLRENCQGLTSKTRIFTGVSASLCVAHPENLEMSERVRVILPREFLVYAEFCPLPNF